MASNTPATAFTYMAPAGQLNAAPLREVHMVSSPAPRGNMASVERSANYSGMLMGPGFVAALVGASALARRNRRGSQKAATARSAAQFSMEELRNKIASMRTGKGPTGTPKGPMTGGGVATMTAAPPASAPSSYPSNANASSAGINFQELRDKVHAA
eukprot:CAMPEP_0170590446 /NCGR_PEP_ID=MMETSP0224-20130122/11876_1 /TAXON_ID=285029 /ORGANISM="Togula jolla, Strain CCCM 725" /LENGTH=156 /DNA_ID=CAMNT_0010914247 /DNA_START=78 /DNA_END=544 /DNA_ORIENTATION=-